MIPASSLDRVVEAMAPLYAAMTLGYGAVRWWHALTPDQCTGINRFVSIFAIPLLTFHLLNPLSQHTKQWVSLTSFP